MGFTKTRAQRIARTLDGGYLYRDTVYRSASSGLWLVEFPNGSAQTVASQEKAHRAIDEYLDKRE